MADEPSFEDLEKLVAGRDKLQGLKDELQAAHGELADENLPHPRLIEIAQRLKAVLSSGGGRSPSGQAPTPPTPAQPIPQQPAAPPRRLPVATPFRPSKPLPAEPAAPPTTQRPVPAAVSPVPQPSPVPVAPVPQQPPAPLRQLPATAPRKLRPLQLEPDAKWKAVERTFLSVGGPIGQFGGLMRWARGVDDAVSDAFKVFRGRDPQAERREAEKARRFANENRSWGANRPTTPVIQPVWGEPGHPETIDPTEGQSAAPPQPVDVSPEPEPVLQGIPTPPEYAAQAARQRLPIAAPFRPPPSEQRIPLGSTPGIPTATPGTAQAATSSPLPTPGPLGQGASLGGAVGARTGVLPGVPSGGNGAGAMQGLMQLGKDLIQALRDLTDKLNRLDRQEEPDPAEKDVPAGKRENRVKWNEGKPPSEKAAPAEPEGTGFKDLLKIAGPLRLPQNIPAAPR